MSNIKFYKPISIQRTPCAGDYVMKLSYNKWANGLYQFGPGNDENKFTTIANEYDEGDYLNLQLVGGQVNGLNISMCTVSSVYVNYANLAARDDGYGSWYSNYTDFFNNIFIGFSLFSTLSTGDDLYWRINYCKLDDFTFIFRETGQLYETPISEVYFTLQAKWGWTVSDSIAQTLGFQDSQWFNWYNM